LVKQKLFSWLLWLLIGLLLPALACAVPAVGPAPLSPTEPAPVPEANAAPPGARAGIPLAGGATPPPAVDTGGTDDSLSLYVVTETLASLHSYRMQMQLRYTATARDADQWFASETVYVAQPRATSVTLHFGDSAQGETGDSLTLVQVGNHSYTAIPGFGCLSDAAGGSAAGNPFADLTTPDTFLRGLSNARRVLPDQLIRAIPVRHYTFDHNALQELPGQITSLEGHIYLAQDGDHLVRLTMVAHGREIAALGQNEEGRLTLELDLFDVNEALAVVPPAECGQAAAAPYPVLPGASGLTLLPDFFTYRSPQPFADAVDYYRSEMVTAGWTAAGEESFLDSAALLHFSKNGISVTVHISEESGSDLVTVLILRE
jgi:hypothetical protein